MNTLECSDFTQPGYDGGELPEGFELWRRGVVCTRMSEVPVEFVTVGVRRLAGSGDYAPLYALAKALLARQAPAATVIRHGWPTVGPCIFVFVTGVVGRAEGRPEPTDAELSVDGGDSLELLQAAGPQREGEVFNEFDLGNSRGISMISYGERVLSAAGFNYEPFMARAEDFARRHYGESARILRREWFCATGPDVVVAHLFLAD